MDASQIIQDLNRKFAAPLPEFYKRRIVVWYDEDREFEDQIDSLTITGAKILKLTGSNNFYAKKLLAVDDATSSYLVYCPLSYETEEDDWLLDVELYSEEFRADQISMWMDQLYFTDSTGKPVSDTATIIADKTSDNGQERTFRCSFNLKQLKYSNTEQYYLVITDENGMIVSREEFQIDIAFAVDEFDFFS